MAENWIGMAGNYTRVAGWLLSVPRLVDRAFARLARNRRWSVAGVGLFAVLYVLLLVVRSQTARAERRIAEVRDKALDAGLIES